MPAAMVALDQTGGRDVQESRTMPVKIVLRILAVAATATLADWIWYTLGVRHMETPRGVGRRIAHSGPPAGARRT